MAQERELLKPSSSSSLPLKLSTQEFQLQEQRPVSSLAAFGAAPATAAEFPEGPARFANRCWSCRRRVGLAGFRCRCGELFCPRHRYSDDHKCSFDYKAAAREQISKANPVIRPSKIIKI